MRNISLLLLLSASLAVAATPDEEKAMYDGYIYYQRAGSSDAEKALQYYQQCVDVFAPLIQANPGLANELAKPSASARDTAGFVLKSCQDGVEQLKTRGGGDFKALVDALYEIAPRGANTSPEDTKQCINLIDAALKKNPQIANEEYFESGQTIGEVRAMCSERLARYNKQAQQESRSAEAALSALKTKYDKAVQAFKKASQMPEKNNAQILTKYKEFRGLRDSFDDILRSMGSAVGMADPATLKVGNLSYTAFSAQVKNSQQQYQQTFTPLNAKADKAFAAQDAQLNATLPKLISGEKLAVFKRRGIPFNWRGGATAAKNGVYTGDGTLIAKDLAAATQWLYQENSEGCYYYYSFSGNKVVKLETPIFCK